MSHAVPAVAWHRHADEATWARAVADAVAAALPAGVPSRVLLSGGGTPAPVYRQLAVHPGLDWRQLVLGLVDERWLPDGDPDRNDTLVRTHLLDHQPQARLLPLARPAVGPGPSLQQALADWEAGPPARAALLGMGNDAHTASLFPGAAALAEIAASPRPYALLDATGCPGAQHWPQRLTLTPSGLAAIPHRLLLLRGAQKAAVLERALADGDPLAHPVLFACRGLPPLQVHWCP